MPQLPRDIGEQIAGTRRTRLVDLIRRLLGLKPPPPPPPSGGKD